MIIILDKDENPELAELALKEILANPQELKKARKWLFWQTDLDYEDLKFVIDIYVR